LVEAGKARLHRVLPESGWISYRIRSEDDVAPVIELFRLSYEQRWKVDGSGGSAGSSRSGQTSESGGSRPH
jgi:luciferase-like monooxygenase